jgi:hypothetical protein
LGLFATCMGSLPIRYANSSGPFVSKPYPSVADPDRSAMIAFTSRFRQRIHAGIAPHIGPITPKPSQLNVVAMRLSSFSEYKNQLTLGAIKRAHSTIVFRPHAEIEERVIGFLASQQDLGYVTPVHTDEVSRAIGAMTLQERKCLAKLGDLHEILLNLPRWISEGLLVDPTEKKGFS